VPGRVAVDGRRPKACVDPGRGSTSWVELCAMGNDDWDDDGGGGPGGGAEMVAETTAESGGSVRLCASGLPAVGGRLWLLDPGRPCPPVEGRLKLNWEERPRKDCDCCCSGCEDDWGTRKDWPGARKEWLLLLWEGLEC
jgi:hypothetical protein